MATKKERYDLLFVIKDIFCMYFDTTETKHTKLLNKQNVQLTQQHKPQGTIVHHDEKSGATGRSQEHQV